MTTLGEMISFGQHKGNTIEQIHFINYSWLDWAMRQPNLSWIKDYIENLPRIYPNKIKIHCGENHHSGCKTKLATLVSLPMEYSGYVDATPWRAYFWCLECSVKPNPDHTGIMAYDLNFRSLMVFKKEHQRKRDYDQFHFILRKAYGIDELTAEAAYKVFWD